MKRAVAAAISLMTGLAMLTGCSRAEVEETIQPLVADAIEESDSEAEAVKEEDESPLIPEIDTDIKIHAGSRIAVVSKCVKGEYWKMVKKGMEDAVKEINKAYSYKKDDQITQHPAGIWFLQQILPCFRCQQLFSALIQWHPAYCPR